MVTRLLSLPVEEAQPEHLFARSPHQRPNHVLINEYPPGIGIMPHKVSLDEDEYHACCYSMLIPRRMELHTGPLSVP